MSSLANNARINLTTIGTSTRPGPHAARDIALDIERQNDACIYVTSSQSHNGNTISQYGHRFMLGRIVLAHGNPIVIYRLEVKCGRFIGCVAAPSDDLVSPPVH
ncbi:unnamed protein product [Pieris macdunnoughi]|uniref:Uncharacterized protein n=1 Tax=Pieris macdunnoughi TaxID=345717 RepID=A0A821T4B6_9NEOP|nr:unnamed protein product [Pieris macdunnoughi]